MPEEIHLSEAQRKFVEEWRGMHAFWGVEEETAHAQAVLFLLQKPVASSDLAELMGISTQKLSAALRPLLDLEMISEVEVQGDRRKHVMCEMDIWEMIRRLFKKRVENEVLHPARVVRQCVKMSKARGDKREWQQFREILELYELMEMAYHQVDRLSTQRIRQLVHMAMTGLQLLEKRDAWWPGGGR